MAPSPKIIPGGKPRTTNNSRSAGFPQESPVIPKNPPLAHRATKSVINSPRNNPAMTKSPLAPVSHAPAGMAVPFTGAAIHGEGNEGRSGRSSPEMERDTASESSIDSANSELSALRVEGLLRTGNSPRSDTTVHTKNRVSFEVPPLDVDPYSQQETSIFAGIPYMDDAPLYPESLYTTLTKNHAPYQHGRDPDPLDDFGGINGILPGRTEFESLQIRYILLRMSTPPLDCMWEKLSSAVKDFGSYTFKVEELVRHVDPVSPILHYLLHKERLKEIGNIVLALNQVLDCWADFFYKGKGMSFNVDPEYKMVRLLAWDENPLDLILTGPMLQKRCHIAMKHIVNYVNTLSRANPNNQGCESVSSYNSTLPSVQENYATLSPLAQITAFAARDDYRTDLTKDTIEGRSILLERHEKFMRPPLLSAPYIYHERVPSLPPPSSNVEDVSSQPRLPDTVPHSVTPPVSISSLSRKHTITVVPGVGNVPSIPLPPAPKKSGGPSVPTDGIPMPSSSNEIQSRTTYQFLRPPIQSGLPSHSADFWRNSSKTGHDRNSGLGLFSSNSTLFGEKPIGGSSDNIGKGGSGNKDNGPPDGPAKGPPGGPSGGPPGGPPFGGPSGGSGGPPSGGPSGGSGGPPPGGPTGGSGGPPGGPGGPNNGPNPGQPAPPPPPPPPPGNAAAAVPQPNVGPNNDYVWQINHKIGLSSIPHWDGKGETLIDYLSSISGLTRLGDRMCIDVAQLATQHWAGDAKLWWDTLPTPEQLYFLGHWDLMLNGIRHQFMNETWVRARIREFEEMKFRQRGHGDETPLRFIQRRIQYHQFLFSEDTDGPSSVARILRTQPSEWGTTLNEYNCPSVLELMNVASRMASSLESQYVLAENIKRSNLAPDPSSANSRPFSRRRRRRFAHAAEAGEPNDDEGEESSLDDEEEHSANVASSSSKSRPPPPTAPHHAKFPEGKRIGDYSFTRDDSVSSARAPKGSCYICTSPKHYFRDCPHYGRFTLLRNANLIVVDLDPKVEADWDREYMAMLVESNASSSYDLTETKEAFIMDAVTTGAFALHASNKGNSIDNRNTRRRMQFEKKGKGVETPANSVDNVLRAERRAKLNTRLTAPVPTPEMDRDCKPIFVAPRSRALPEGLGSLGSRALHIKAKVHSLESDDIKARLDSGADITLMSEDLYNTIPGLPKIKEGLRMKLYHLTGNAKVLGYTRTKLYTKATNGTTISFELEAYVVRGMRVPLLIGEDFQSTYEIGLVRYATGHTEVKIGNNSQYIVDALSASTVDLGFEIRQAFLSQSFVRTKAIRRAKAKTSKNEDRQPVVAIEDVKIAPGSVHNVRIAAAFGSSEEWLVEKVLIGTDTADVLAAPTTWINVNAPYLPIANPSPRPWYIQVGDVVGHLLSPSDLDHPTAENISSYVASAECITAIIAGTLKEQDLASASSMPAPNADQLDDDPNWGPKTSALPDEKVTGDIAELVNLGPDIPANIMPQLESILQKNAAAFGVDGRLGHVEAKVEVPLKPGTRPVSVPMYSASPAKREVIEKQIGTWFEAGVIELSVSPWGFPVVVVYRNGKPRLVVDYRKLNAQTVPDEFPIPRQSEIIQALSGSQVLSSFDALAGFTQLEMAEEEKEKTAFRCHLGLFQFKRMPFGLRNGPSIFQRIMQGVLAPFLWLFTLVYIDDIVVFSKSWEDHLVHLDKVLAAIARAGITLSPSKCYVGFASILLLGQKVSRLGLSTHEEKVAAVMELERPRSMTELQKFLGMIVYFSQYIPFYSFIASPLFALLRKGAKWQWLAEHEIAWQQAKDALSNAVMHQY